MAVRLSTSGDDRVVIAALDGARGNPIDHDTVSDLARALDALTDDQALLITGRAGMFTGGLDLAVLQAGGDAARALLDDMGRLLIDILRSPRPVLVAADGHGIAAGAMLMLVADIALVSDRTARYGFAEVRSGLPLPAAVCELIAARVQPRASLRLAAHGELVGPGEAVALGLADEMVPAASLLERATGRAAELAALPAVAYATTKQKVTDAVVAAMGAHM